MTELAPATSGSATAHGLARLAADRSRIGDDRAQRVAQTQLIGDLLERDAIRWTSNATDQGEMRLFQEPRTVQTGSRGSPPKAMQPSVLNAADEIAVESFLNGDIKLQDISRIAEIAFVHETILSLRAPSLRPPSL